MCDVQKLETQMSSNRKMAKYIMVYPSQTRLNAHWHVEKAMGKTKHSKSSTTIHAFFFFK